MQEIVMKCRHKLFLFDQNDLSSMLLGGVIVLLIIIRQSLQLLQSVDHDMKYFFPLI